MQSTNAAALAASAQADAHDLADFLHRMTGLAAHVLPGDVAVGITVIRDGKPATVASSDPRAVHVDEVQYGVGDGPCLHAARTGEVVRVTDVTSDPRWPLTRERALTVGIHSSLSLPLNASAGAINVYASRPYAFTEAEEETVTELAHEIDTVIGSAIRMGDRTNAEQQLQQALVSRAVINQAVGIVMAQQHCDPKAAFQVLARASQNRNLKLRHLAAELVGDVGGKVPPSRDGETEHEGY